METTLRWFKPDELLPMNSQHVLCVMSTTNIIMLSYSAKHKKFNASDFSEPDHAIEPLLWARIPAPLHLHIQALFTTKTEAENESR